MRKTGVRGPDQLRTNILDDLEVGFSIVLTANMRPGFVADRPDPSAIYTAGIVMISNGIASDRFVAGLSKLYGLPMPAAKMSEQFSIACVATHGDPRNFREQQVRFKLLFGSPDESATYAEAFLHVNYPAAWIALVEKDGTHRANLISALVLGAPSDWH